jgi:hypothetical protein
MQSHLHLQRQQGHQLHHLRPSGSVSAEKEIQVLGCGWRIVTCQFRNIVLLKGLLIGDLSAIHLVPSFGKCPGMRVTRAWPWAGACAA